MFQGITLQSFNKFFTSEDDCQQYLFELKWKEGFRCRKCGCTKNYKGRTRFYMRCQLCGYDESATANTMFHKLKIPLLKAFGMSFRLSVSKKGMSTNELAREFSINQKSSWLFKRKTQEAMKSSGNHPIDTKVEVDELLIGGPEKGKRGRSKGAKKLVVIAIEKVKNGKIGRAYAEVIEEASGKCFKPFFDRHIDKEKAKVITDCWRGYWPVAEDYNIRQKKSKRGKNFSDMHIIIMNLKGWLRGIHHHCSKRFLNGYLDEFFFRFNRRNFLTSIWHKLIERFVTNATYIYKAIAN